MSSSRHTCNCSDCVEQRTALKEWQGGGMDWETDEDELIPYRKKRRRKRRYKVCAKSKTGEPCEYTATKVIGTTRKYDRITKTFVNMPQAIKVCERCGRYDWYNWSYLP